MFVWWAVFFFAGALFPSGSAGAETAMGAISILVLWTWRYQPDTSTRAYITCASGLFVLVTASLSPIDRGSLTGSSVKAIRRTGQSSVPVTAVRQKIITISDESELSDEARGLLRALLIADRKLLSREIRREWKNTGTAHYLALSGLHLGLIAVPLFGLLTLAGARGIIRDITALLALSFYAAVAGRPGSLLRALSMMTVMRTSRLGGIRIGLAQCVVTGAFIVCILDPQSLNDTGFLLSFNAAAGVALLGVPACRSIQHRMAGWRGSRVMAPPLLALTMSLCVQASMLPLSVRIFGFAPLSGPLMSVIMALPVTALLYGGFIYAIAGHIWRGISALSLNLLSALAIGMVSRGAEISRAGFIITDFDIRLYIPGLSLCAIALRCEKYRSVILISGLILAVVSFHPVFTGRDGGGGETIWFPDHGGVLHGGNNGVLVLDNWPAAWSASYLSREVRRSGTRSIGTLVILDPGGFDAEGISILAGDLTPESILLSPWFDGPSPGIVDWIYVRQDTILEAGTRLLAVRAPAILPARGVCASTGDASIFISSLD